MAKITVILPRTVADVDHLTLEALDYQQLFMKLLTVNPRIFSLLFRETDLGLRPKPYVAMFVNNEQVFDSQHALRDGDRIVFATAIAGG